MVDYKVYMCSYLMISPESGVKNASTTGYSLVAVADLPVVTLLQAEVEEYVDAKNKPNKERWEELVHRLLNSV